MAFKKKKKTEKKTQKKYGKYLEALLQLNRLAWMLQQQRFYQNWMAFSYLVQITTLKYTASLLSCHEQLKFTVRNLILLHKLLPFTNTVCGLYQVDV